MEIYDIKGLSNEGLKRKENQDRFIKPSKIPTINDEIPSKGCLIAVADGMGGHKGGGMAAQIAVNVLENEYYKDKSQSITSSLKSAFSKANQKIYLMATENTEYKGMGTTLTAIVLKYNTFYFAHVGDSRGYIVSSRKIKQFTQDHSIVADLIKAKIITEKDAEKHPDRNVITRALGVDKELKVDVSEKPLKLKKNNYILLCSDGLYKVVDKNELKDVIFQIKNPEEICNSFIEIANERGGPDNTTVVLAIQNDIKKKKTLLNSIKQIFTKKA